MDDLTGPVRILSDLHLGHPACRLGSVEPLRPILIGAKTVIFNGDTWEQGNAILKDHAEMLYQDLLALLDELDITPIFIRGNHDPLISDLDWVDARETFITHGDCLFETISPWNPNTWKHRDEYARIRSEITGKDLASSLEYTRRCRLVGERDEHRFSSGRFRIMRSVLKFVYPPRRAFEVLRCWKETPRRADLFRKHHRPDSKIVVIGHIHHPGIWKRPDGYTLINTGGFLSVGKAQVLELNGSTARVFKVDESNPEAFFLREIWAEEKSFI